MSRKLLFHWLLTITLLFIVAFFWPVLLSARVSADCGMPPKSSCISCHVPDGHVQRMGEWNNVHTSQDLCVNCHGGNGSTMDKTLAHEGITVQPLSDIYTDCHSCHPADYVARADKLAATLNVTPGSCSTPTPMAFISEPGKQPPGGIAANSGDESSISVWSKFTLMIGVLAVFTIFIFGLNWLDKHPVRV